MENDEDLMTTKEFIPEDMEQTEKDTENLDIVEDKLDEEVSETREGKHKKKGRNPFKVIAEKWKLASKKKKALIIIIGVIVLAGLATGGFFLYKALKKDGGNTKLPAEVIMKDNYKYSEGKLFILDENDKEIGTYECDNKDEKLCYVAYELNDDNFTNEKYIYNNNEPVLKRSKVYENRYVFVFDNKKEDDVIVHLYDLKENKKIEIYQGVKSYSLSDKEVVVLKDDQSLFSLNEIDKDGIKNIIKSEYDYLGMISETGKQDKVVAKTGTKWSILGIDGKTLTKNFDQEVANFTKDKVLLVSNSKYFIADYNATILSDFSTKFTVLLDDYYLYIDDSNNLKVKDYEHNKMLEEGIKITSTDYVRTYVYNEDKKLEETRQAFEVELESNILTVKTKENEETVEKQINLLEGKISANYNYYSYFDGFLYFYSDGLKETLIGSYKCNNKNTITTEATAFDKCLVGTDTNEDDNEMDTKVTKTSVIPIYNNRFVFIHDAGILTTDNSVKINLYDLVAKKTHVSYISVNTYSRDNNGGVYHENVTDKQVIAKNKNGKYGIIKIEKATVGSVMAFEYDSITSISGNYLTKKGNKYQMYTRPTPYTSDLIKVGGEIPEQIMGYSGTGFVKTKNNGRYKVYSYDGNQVGTATYKYIDFISGLFYIGVNNNNEIEIYTTAGEKKFSGIKLYSEEYYGVDNTAFKLQYANLQITLSVLNGGSYTDHVIDVNTWEEK